MSVSDEISGDDRTECLEAILGMNTWLVEIGVPESFLDNGHLIAQQFSLYKLGRQHALESLKDKS